MEASVPPAWAGHMDEALRLAVDPQAPRGENPRVGCVILDAAGIVVGRGFHRGAGTAHAEVVALEEAGAAARGGTAFVTLEPCRHRGRTGPCTAALIAAGIDRVIFAQVDPTLLAGGGGHELTSAGIEVIGEFKAPEAIAINAEWTTSMMMGRPFVIAKTAMSLDGRVAGPQGEQLAISGPAAQVRAHQIRSQVQAIIVGTGTVLTDDPELTVRHGVEVVGEPPLRVVMGGRDIPRKAHIHNTAAPTWCSGTRSPDEVLAELFERGIRVVLVEGGPTLIGSFMSAGLVDRWVWFISPLLIGAGPTALASMSSVVGVDVVDVFVLGEDVTITAERRTTGS